MLGLISAGLSRVILGPGAGLPHAILDAAASSTMESITDDGIIEPILTEH